MDRNYRDTVTGEKDVQYPATGEELLEGTQLQDERNRELVRRIQDGDRHAEAELCQNNRRLVRWFAERYFGSAAGKVELDDLEQEGIMGLLEAAKKFDFAKGVKFSTYASYWIRQEISRFIKNNVYTVRIPVHRMDQIARVQKAETEFDEERNQDKRNKKIAEKLGISVADVEKDLEISNDYIKMSSLDAKIGTDEDTSVMDMQTDTGEKTVEQVIEDEDTEKRLAEAIGTLKPREQEIVKLRFGLKDGREHTFEEIGEKYGLTRERVRQITNRALQKLRETDALSGYED